MEPEAPGQAERDRRRTVRRRGSSDLSTKRGLGIVCPFETMVQSALVPETGGMAGRAANLP